MFIIEVIPLTILPPNAPQILSYFWGSALQKGAIVEIMLNKRKTKAVVLSSNPLEKEKLTLKKVGFQIKKVNKVLFEKPRVSGYQLKLASWVAKYYHAPLGYTLKTILPSFALKKKYPLTIPTEVIHRNLSPTCDVGYPQIWVYKTKKMINLLEPLIKNTAPKQVLILVSEKASIKYFSDNLSGELGASVVFSGMPNEKLYDIWKKAASGKVKVIIGTRQALTMPFKDLGLIIVDDPLHEFYKSDMMPRYNAVKLAHKVVELNNARLILTSVVAGVENYHKVKNGEYELKNIEARPEFDTEIVDLAQEIKTGNWSVVSKKLKEEILTYLKNGKKILLFSPRRGYAGIMICGNCGSSVRCPQCDVAMRTHRSVEMILVCHHCGISKPMPKNCPVCGNYNLKTAGPAGTQKIYDEVKSVLANAGVKAKVLALDTDIVKNKTEEEEIISEMLKPEPAVLIATQMVFSHRFYLSFNLITMINLDALINMPDFRSEENLFYQIEKLINFLPAEALAKTGEPKKLIIQTYNPENKLLEKAALGNYEEFYEAELKLREMLNYPPFYKLIKLTFRHKDQNKASYAARITTEKLKMAIARARLGEEVKLIEAMPAYIEKEKGLFIYNIFLKVRKDYPDIGNILKYVGPGWIIDVEPRSLL